MADIQNPLWPLNGAGVVLNPTANIVSPTPQVNNNNVSAPQTAKVLVKRSSPEPISLQAASIAQNAVSLATDALEQATNQSIETPVIPYFQDIKPIEKVGYDLSPTLKNEIFQPIETTNKIFNENANKPVIIKPDTSIWSKAIDESYAAIEEIDLSWWPLSDARNTWVWIWKWLYALWSNALQPLWSTIREASKYDLIKPLAAATDVAWESMIYLWDKSSELIWWWFDQIKTEKDWLWNTSVDIGKEVTAWTFWWTVKTIGQTLDGLAVSFLDDNDSKDTYLKINTEYDMKQQEVDKLRSSWNLTKEWYEKRISELQKEKYRQLEDLAYSDDANSAALWSNMLNSALSVAIIAKWLLTAWKAFTQPTVLWGLKSMAAWLGIIWLESSTNIKKHAVNILLWNDGEEIWDVKLVMFKTLPNVDAIKIVTQNAIDNTNENNLILLNKTLENEWYIWLPITKENFSEYVGNTFTDSRIWVNNWNNALHAWQLNSDARGIVEQKTRSTVLTDVVKNDSWDTNKEVFVPEDTNSLWSIKYQSAVKSTELILSLPSRLNPHDSKDITKEIRDMNKYGAYMSSYIQSFISQDGITDDIESESISLLKNYYKWVDYFSSESEKIMKREDISSSEKSKLIKNIVKNDPIFNNLITYQTADWRKLNLKQAIWDLALQNSEVYWSSVLKLTNKISNYIVDKLYDLSWYGDERYYKIWQVQEALPNLGLLYVSEKLWDSIWTLAWKGGKAVWLGNTLRKDWILRPTIKEGISEWWSSLIDSYTQINNPYIATNEWVLSNILVWSSLWLGWWFSNALARQFESAWWTQWWWWWGWWWWATSTQPNKKEIIRKMAIDSLNANNIPVTEERVEEYIKQTDELYAKKNDEMSEWLRKKIQWELNKDNTKKVIPDYWGLQKIDNDSQALKIDALDTLFETRWTDASGVSQINKDVPAIVKWEKVFYKWEARNVYRDNNSGTIYLSDQDVKTEDFTVSLAKETVTTKDWLAFVKSGSSTTRLFNKDISLYNQLDPISKTRYDKNVFYNFLNKNKYNKSIKLSWEIINWQEDDWYNQSPDSRTMKIKLKWDTTNTLNKDYIITVDDKSVSNKDNLVWKEVTFKHVPRYEVTNDDGEKITILNAVHVLADWKKIWAINETDLNTEDQFPYEYSLIWSKDKKLLNNKFNAIISFIEQIFKAKWIRKENIIRLDSNDNFFKDWQNYSQRKWYYDRINQQIVLTPYSDYTTVLHETAHAYLDIIATKEEKQQILDIYNITSPTKEETLTGKVEEKFARWFEYYIVTKELVDDDKISAEQKSFIITMFDGLAAFYQSLKKYFLKFSQSTKSFQSNEAIRVIYRNILNAWYPDQNIEEEPTDGDKEQTEIEKILEKEESDTISDTIQEPIDNIETETKVQNVVTIVAQWEEWYDKLKDFAQDLYKAVVKVTDSVNKSIAWWKEDPYEPIIIYKDIVISLVTNKQLYYDFVNKYKEWTTEDLVKIVLDNTNIVKYQDYIDDKDDLNYILNSKLATLHNWHYNVEKNILKQIGREDPISFLVAQESVDKVRDWVLKDIAAKHIIADNIIRKMNRGKLPRLSAIIEKIKKWWPDYYQNIIVFLKELWFSNRDIHHFSTVWNSSRLIRELLTSFRPNTVNEFRDIISLLWTDVISNDIIKSIPNIKQFIQNKKYVDWNQFQPLLEQIFISQKEAIDDLYSKRIIEKDFDAVSSKTDTTLSLLYDLMIDLSIIKNISSLDISKKMKDILHSSMIIPHTISFFSNKFDKTYSSYLNNMIFWYIKQYSRVNKMSFYDYYKRSDSFLKKDWKKISNRKENIIKSFSDILILSWEKWIENLYKFYNTKYNPYINIFKEEINNIIKKPWTNPNQKYKNQSLFDAIKFYSLSSKDNLIKSFYNNIKNNLYKEAYDDILLINRVYQWKDYNKDFMPIAKAYKKIYSESYSNHIENILKYDNLLLNVNTKNIYPAILNMFMKQWLTSDFWRWVDITLADWSEVNIKNFQLKSNTDHDIFLEQSDGWYVSIPLWISWISNKANRHTIVLDWWEEDIIKSDSLKGKITDNGIFVQPYEWIVITQKDTWDLVLNIKMNPDGSWPIIDKNAYDMVIEWLNALEKYWHTDILTDLFASSDFDKAVRTSKWDQWLWDMVAEALSSSAFKTNSLWEEVNPKLYNILKEKASKWAKEANMKEIAKTVQSAILEKTNLLTIHDWAFEWTANFLDSNIPFFWKQLYTIGKAYGMDISWDSAWIDIESFSKDMTELLWNIYNNWSDSNRNDIDNLFANAISSDSQSNLLRWIADLINYSIFYKAEYKSKLSDDVDIIWSSYSFAWKLYNVFKWDTNKYANIVSQFSIIASGISDINTYRALIDFTNWKEPKGRANLSKIRSLYELIQSLFSAFDSESLKKIQAAYMNLWVLDKSTKREFVEAISPKSDAGFSAQLNDTTNAFLNLVLDSIEFQKEVDTTFVYTTLFSFLLTLPALANTPMRYGLKVFFWTYADVWIWNSSVWFSLNKDVPSQIWSDSEKVNTFFSFIDDVYKNFWQKALNQIAKIYGKDIGMFSDKVGRLNQVNINLFKKYILQAIRKKNTEWTMSVILRNLIDLNNNYGQKWIPVFANVFGKIWNKYDNPSIINKLVEKLNTLKEKYINLYDSTDWKPLQLNKDQSDFIDSVIDHVNNKVDFNKPMTFVLKWWAYTGKTEILAKISEALHRPWEWKRVIFGAKYNITSNNIRERLQKNPLTSKNQVSTFFNITDAGIPTKRKPRWLLSEKNIVLKDNLSWKKYTIDKDKHNIIVIDEAQGLTNEDVNQLKRIYNVNTTFVLIWDPSQPNIWWTSELFKRNSDVNDSWHKTYHLDTLNFDISKDKLSIFLTNLAMKHTSFMKEFLWDRFWWFPIFFWEDGDWVKLVDNIDVMIWSFIDNLKKAIASWSDDYPTFISYSNKERIRLNNLIRWSEQWKPALEVWELLISISNDAWAIKQKTVVKSLWKIADLELTDEDISIINKLSIKWYDIVNINWVPSIFIPDAESTNYTWDELPYPVYTYWYATTSDWSLWTRSSNVYVHNDFNKSINGSLQSERLYTAITRVKWSWQVQILNADYIVNMWVSIKNETVSPSWSSDDYNFSWTVSLPYYAWLSYKDEALSLYQYIVEYDYEWNNLVYKWENEKSKYEFMTYLNRRLWSNSIRWDTFDKHEKFQDLIAMIKWYVSMNDNLYTDKNVAKVNILINMYNDKYDLSAIPSTSETDTQYTIDPQDQRRSFSPIAFLPFKSNITNKKLPFNSADFWKVLRTWNPKTDPEINNLLQVSKLLQQDINFNTDDYIEYDLLWREYAKKNNNKIWNRNIEDIQFSSYLPSKKWIDPSEAFRDDIKVLPNIKSIIEDLSILSDPDFYSNKAKFKKAKSALYKLTSYHEWMAENNIVDYKLDYTSDKLLKQIRDNHLYSFFQNEEIADRVLNTYDTDLNNLYNKIWKIYGMKDITNVIFDKWTDWYNKKLKNIDINFEKIERKKIPDSTEELWEKYEENENIRSMIKGYNEKRELLYIKQRNKRRLLNDIKNAIFRLFSSEKNNENKINRNIVYMKTTWFLDTINAIEKKIKSIVDEGIKEYNDGQLKNHPNSDYIVEKYKQKDESAKIVNEWWWKLNEIIENDPNSNVTFTINKYLSKDLISYIDKYRMDLIREELQKSIDKNNEDSIIRKNLKSLEQDYFDLQEKFKPRNC